VSVFTLVHGSSLVYNQCWEDPALDREALQLGPRDRVMVITSAGCNALDYALTGAEVLAVDVNPRQNHLLELKCAGIRALDHCSFFELFGSGGTTHAHELYREMRPWLSVGAALYWDRAIDAFDPRRAPRGSFYYTGTSGWVAGAMRFYAERIARVSRALERLLAATQLEEQLEVYYAHVRPRLLRDEVLGIVAWPPVLALLGVPAPQRALVATDPGGVPGYIRGCLDRVMRLLPLGENYFWSVYLTGRYSRRCCPEYLVRDGFARLKAGLVDQVRIFTGTVTECLAQETRPVTAFSLLDHMDWMTRQPDVLQQEWDLLHARAAPGARVIFRSGAADAGFLPPQVRERLAFDDETASRLHTRDRVGTYASFHLARVAA
jgi:S-adenosylmethionine-diacylglycerol 3-amino-3-carboxypropyl transferase